MFLVVGWVTQLVGGQKNGAKGFMFFIVNCDLSEDGIGKVPLNTPVIHICSCVLSYIADILCKLHPSIVPKIPSIVSRIIWYVSLWKQMMARDFFFIKNKHFQSFLMNIFKYICIWNYWTEICTFFQLFPFCWVSFDIFEYSSLLHT